MGPAKVIPLSSLMQALPARNIPVVCLPRSVAFCEGIAWNTKRRLRLKDNPHEHPRCVDGGTKTRPTGSVQGEQNKRASAE